MHSFTIRLLLYPLLLGKTLFTQATTGFKILNSLKNMGYEELSDKCYQYIKDGKKEIACSHRLKNNNISKTIKP